MLDPETLGICPICGGTEFEPGFGGRLDRNGNGPQCANCKSAERHRIINLLYQKLRPYLADKRALQFAPEGAVRADWFARFDYSVYGGHNSLDMTATGLDSGAYDLIISNHVIEHVSSDFAALRECLRVVGPDGVVHVNAPSPMFRFETVDWGFADPARNEHYRDYGADMGIHLLQAVPRAHCIAVIGIDPVTTIPDVIYFFSENRQSLKALAAPLREVPVVVLA